MNDKSPFTNIIFQKAKWQHKNATKIFDYTAIAGRLMAASLSNYNRPTGIAVAVGRNVYKDLTIAWKSKEKQLWSPHNIYDYVFGGFLVKTNG